jgi:hypothetical protein
MVALVTVQLVIRLMDESDPETVSAAFTALGWHKPPEMYQRYLAEQEEGRLLAFLAEWRGEFAGYVTLVWVRITARSLSARSPRFPISTFCPRTAGKA